MTAVAAASSNPGTTELPVMPRGPMIREASRIDVKNKDYQSSPVGAEVGRYMRELQISHNPKTTRDSYEQVLYRLAIDHDDFTSLERFADTDGEEYLFEFLDRHWKYAALSTKRHHHSILKSFFTFAVEKGRISRNPTPKIKWRGGGQIDRQAYPQEVVQRLIGAQDQLRDRCALGLLRLALRKNDLRMLQLGDIDLTRNLVSLKHGKGGKVALLPIEFEDLQADLYLHLGVEREWAADEYLLYPRSHRLRPMDPASIHRWFKRCLADAGLPQTVKMHELRHTALDDLWRRTGDLMLAKQLARHASVGTTEAYLHPSTDDLRAGLRVVDEAWRKG